MNSILQEALPFLVIPILAIAVAGLVPLFYIPKLKARSYIQHFAAGMVFAAVAAELLPSMQELALVPVVTGFALGTLAMLGVKWMTERTAHSNIAKAGRHEGPFNIGLLVIVAIDVLVDGLLIGLGFALGAEAGMLLTIALATEGFFLSLTAAVEIKRGGLSMAKVLGATICFGLLLGVGAVLGILLLGDASPLVLALVLSFGSAALLYLVTEELLVEAHEHGFTDSPLSAALFFFGFLLVIGIEMAAH